MAINLNDKTNKSIAALASKIMQEQPTKVREFTDTKPIESDMVQRVMNTGMKGNFIKEDAEQLDEIGDTPKGKEVLRNYISTAAKSVHNKAYRAGKKYGETEKYDVPNIAGSIKRQLSITQAANRLAKEEVEQVDEGRFGKAIDPSKLSPEARARIAARDAAKKPVEAKPGTKLGDIAASFKKPEPKKEEPKEEPKPAAKTGNKFTQLRQQNMERMKQHQAAVAAGKVGGGSGQRSGGNTGENPDARDKESDLVKSSHEIAGEKAAAHGGTKGAIVSGSLKPDKTANKKKPGEDEHDDVHEALKGNQHRIDANHNGRIDGHDFKLLRAKHKKGK
jgi:hypothetical protein